MFLKKFRSSTKKRSDDASNLSKKSTRSIFRSHSKKNGSKKSGGAPPLATCIQQSNTWSLSEDSGSPKELLMHPVQFDSKILGKGEIAKGNNTITFTEDEIMQNELNHMRQLADKDEQITSHKNENKQLKKRFEEAMAELEVKYQNELALKELELAAAKTLLEETKSDLAEQHQKQMEELRIQYEESMAELGDKHGKELAEWEFMFEETKSELEEKRQKEVVEYQLQIEEQKLDLQQVSSVLIHTQHELHEQQQNWKDLALSWLPSM